MELVGFPTDWTSDGPFYRKMHFGEEGEEAEKTINVPLSNTAEKEG